MSEDITKIEINVAIPHETPEWAEYFHISFSDPRKQRTFYIYRDKKGEVRTVYCRNWLWWLKIKIFFMKLLGVIPRKIKKCE